MVPTLILPCRLYSLLLIGGLDRLQRQMTPITDSSTHVASDVYRELMRYVSASVENTDWTMPDGLTRIGRELYLEGTYTQPSYSAPFVQQVPTLNQRHLLQKVANQHHQVQQNHQAK